MEYENKSTTLVREVWQVLDGLGYKTALYDDHITVYSAVASRHKNAIRAILAGYLREFFWINGVTTIFVKTENTGLDPDDTRYDILLAEIFRTDPVKNPLESHETDVFVNLNDRFARIVVDSNAIEDILNKQKKGD